MKMIFLPLALLAAMPVAAKEMTPQEMYRYNEPSAAPSPATVPSTVQATQTIAWYEAPAMPTPARPEPPENSGAALRDMLISAGN